MFNSGPLRRKLTSHVNGSGSSRSALLHKNMQRYMTTVITLFSYLCFNLNIDNGKYMGPSIDMLFLERTCTDTHHKPPLTLVAT